MALGTLKYWILSGIMLCILGGCSDDLNDKTKTGGSKEIEYYFAFSIENSYIQGNQTRENGTEGEIDFTETELFKRGLSDERKIYSGKDGEEKRHFAIIFDEEGKNAIDLFALEPMEEKNENSLNSYQVLYGGFKATEETKIKLETGKILVVLNASVAALNKLKDKNALNSYESLLKIILSKESGDSNTDDFVYISEEDTRYFTMSSSMIVKGNEVVPANMKTGPLIFYPSKLEALEKPYKLFVEPLQSKFTLLFQQGDKKFYFDSENLNTKGDISNYECIAGNLEYNKFLSPKEFKPTNEKLRFVKEYTRNGSPLETGKDKQHYFREGEWEVKITGWGINGMETSEYLFKKLTAGNNYFVGWTDIDGIRNYWSEDPHYSTADPWMYPLQYRKYSNTNEDSDYSYETMIHSSDIALNYFSYDEMSLHKPHLYSPENTFSKELLKNSQYFKENNEFGEFIQFQTGTHLIVTAQLIIPELDDESIEEISDKYYMNGIYWSETAYKEYVAEYLGYRMINNSHFDSDDGIIYKNQEGEMALSQDFMIEPVSVSGGDAKVCIKPNDLVTIYTRKGGVYKKIALPDFEKLIAENSDLFADHFKEGKMYYPIAIQHNLNSNPTSKTIETGDYGVVRNHWYVITVNKVLSPGIAVDNTKEKLIPNKGLKEGGLGVNIRILDWHIVGINADVTAQPRPGNDLDIKTDTEDWNHFYGDEDEF